MPRQKRRTVDYFSHDCKHGKTMEILERKYGNDGYAFWFKLLEILGDTEGHYLDFSQDENAIYLSSRASVSEEKCIEILDLLARIDAIDEHLWEEHRVIWSSNFVERLEQVYEKRSGSRPEKPRFCDENPCSRTENPSQNGENVSKTPQSKEKESKEKESKEAESNLPGPTPSEFMDYWNQKMPSEHSIRYMTDNRKEKLRTRRGESAFVDNWKTIIQKASESTFLLNDCRPFDATWVLKNDDNYVKILEGKYDNGQDSGSDGSDYDWDQSDELDPEKEFQPTGG